MIFTSTIDVGMQACVKLFRALMFDKTRICLLAEKVLTRMAAEEKSAGSIFMIETHGQQ